MYYADLHLHSKHSRATAKSSDVPHLAAWARRKGIGLLGTGDFTHPGWRAELREALVPAEQGLLRLRPALERAVSAELPVECRGSTRFVLSVEISTIYKYAERTRKVHHVVLVPDFEAADHLVARLAKIGNLASDGRPILGLDSRNLLEMVLECSPEAFLIPAHIWTPWFSALGSQSGFDSIDDCYRDLAGHVFAVETGLSSDPAMNWRVSSLDRFRLVSSSDAHSPPMLGREACMFDGPLDFPSLRRALETGEGYRGTVEFFPEEGKYHLDGHRNCGVRLEPDETVRLGGRCPVCGKKLTAGVLGRVTALADRGEDAPLPATAGQVRSLVPLRELLAELHGTGAQSKGVARSYDALLRRLGPELPLLTDVPLEEIARRGSTLLAEAIARLRTGRVVREAGFDGQYGVIRLFSPDELRVERRGRSLFDSDSEPPSPAVPLAPRASDRRPRAVPTVATESAKASEPTSIVGMLDALDVDQREAAQMIHGPLLVVAGPGSGKTRMLTHRVAHLIADHGAPPEACLTITFTRRAATEMRERLGSLLPERVARIPIATFHRLGLTILEEHHALAGLPAQPRVADVDQATLLWAASESISVSRAHKQLVRFAAQRRQGGPSGTRAGTTPNAADADQDPQEAERLARYRVALRQEGLVDFDDLIELPVALLTDHPALQDSFRARWQWLSIDEYQDVDPRQVALVRLLAPADGNVCAIGDPDQAIYGFRGADSRLFEQFSDHFPGARRVELRRNYRSDGFIVRAAAELIARADGKPRNIEPVRPEGRRAVVHRAPTGRAEAEQVVCSIERLIGGHTFFALDSGRSDGVMAGDFSFADFAVLYRTEAQAEPIAEALRRAGMPTRRRTHSALRDQPAVRALLDVLRASRTGPARVMIDELRAVAAALVDDGAAEQPLDAAVELLTPLAADFGADLPGFIREVELGASMDCWDPRADCVSLMTIHSAKGLEFPVVFVVGCEEGILPLRFGHDAPVDEPEERRLLYVAMTRARERLVLSYAHRRTWRGAVRDRELSPLLRDLPHSACDWSTTELPSRFGDMPSSQLELFSS